MSNNFYGNSILDEAERGARENRRAVLNTCVRISPDTKPTLYRAWWKRDDAPDFGVCTTADACAIMTATGYRLMSMKALPADAKHFNSYAKGDNADILRIPSSEGASLQWPRDEYEVEKSRFPMGEFGYHGEVAERMTGRELYDYLKAGGHLATACIIEK